MAKARKQTKRVDTKPAARRAPLDLGGLGRAILEAWIVNERMNQIVLESLDERVWNAPPPLAKPGTGRTIAAIVSHIHNVRHMWLVVSAPDADAPDKIDKKSLTLGQARSALTSSSNAMHALLEASIANGGRVKNAGLDVVAFLAYATAHEAHHRGQILLVAKQLGLPLDRDAGFALWDWRKRRKDCGLEA